MTVNFENELSPLGCVKKLIKIFIVPLSSVGDANCTAMPLGLPCLLYVFQKLSMRKLFDTNANL